MEIMDKILKSATPTTDRNQKYKLQCISGQLGATEHHWESAGTQLPNKQTTSTVYYLMNLAVSPLLPRKLIYLQQSESGTYVLFCYVTEVCQVCKRYVVHALITLQIHLPTRFFVILCYLLRLQTIWNILKLFALDGWIKCIKNCRQ